MIRRIKLQCLFIINKDSLLFACKTNAQLWLQMLD